MNLKDYDVQEMNVEEMRIESGGIIGWLVAGLATAFFWDCIMNPSDTKTQVANGYNNYQPK
jgi:hypothetical protein